MPRASGRLRRIRDLVTPGRLEREIDDELRFHLDEEVGAGIRAGLTEQQARRDAEMSLGGSPLPVREQIRDARGISVVDDFRRDVLHGLRLLGRQPGFTLVVLTTFALAIGAVTASFSVSDAWLFRPLAFPEAGRLVVAFAAAPARPSEPAVWMPYRAYVAWKGAARSFRSVSAVFFHGVTWRGAAEATSLVGMRVTPEFFTTFDVPPLLGRALTAADANGPPAVVISHGFWQRWLGGSSSVIGATIELSEMPYRVVGVMPQDFDVRLLDRPEGAAFWTLFKPGEAGYEPNGIGPVAIVARLGDGVTIDAAQSEAAAIMRRNESAYAVNFNQFVVALSSLQSDNTRTVRATLVTVLLAACALLFVAAMNVGGLILGKGFARRGEVAVRYALGAGRMRVVRQLVTECLVLSVGGGLIGVGLALVATRLFLAWNPLGTLPANNVRLDLPAVAVAGAAMALTTVVSGLLPSWRLSSRGHADGLRGAGWTGFAASPARRAQTVMLSAQIAASVVLLVCTALLARTFIQLRATPLGFATDNVTVATVSLPAAAFHTSAERLAFYTRLEERLAARPGVRHVAGATSPPLQGGAVATVYTTEADDPGAPRMSALDVTSGFFDTLAIPVVAGRPFDRRDRALGAPAVVLNARAAMDLFGGVPAAVGRRVRVDRGPWREVVGVVGNVQSTFFNTLEWQTNPQVYRPAAQAFDRTALSAASFTLYLHVRSNPWLSATELRQAARAAGRRAAVLEVQRVPAMVADATKQPTFRMMLLLSFGALSLILAALGVYGLASQAAAEHLRDTAVRLVLGGAPLTVMSALVRRVTMAGIVGLGTGTVASLLSGRALKGLIYGVSTHDAMSLAGVAMLLLAVTAVAACIPARRAARVDPARVLRGE